MRCSKCIEYRPLLSDAYDHYICLACGQAWTWRLTEWVNDGLYNLKSMQKIREDNMADKREGFKFVKALTGDEYFVSMINYNDTVYVCTNKSMYMLVDECMVKMEIEMEDTEAHEAYDEEPILQIDGKYVNHIGGYLIKRVVIVRDKLVNLIMDYDK